MGCRLGTMESPRSLPQIREKEFCDQQPRSLPSFRTVFGADGKCTPYHDPTSVSSQSSHRGYVWLSPDASQRQSPALSSSSSISYTKYASEKECGLSYAVDNCHGFVPSYQLQSSVPNLMDFRNIFMERDLNTHHRPLLPRKPKQSAPWEVENLPFRATPQRHPLPTRSRYRRQSKVKDPQQKHQSKVQHSDKEKWRRDKIATYTEIKRIMHLLSWPGNMSLSNYSGPCKVKNCGPPKSATPKYNSKHGNEKNTKATGGRQHARNNKEEPKSEVLYFDVLWKFSIAVHFERNIVPLIIEEIEELIDWCLDQKEKSLSQKTDAKTNAKARAQGERDVMGTTAYDVLQDMLEQCNAHGIKLDEAIAGRQEGRRIRIELDERQTRFGNKRGTPGSPRTLSEYEGEVGNIEARGGKRRRRAVG